MTHRTSHHPSPITLTISRNHRGVPLAVCHPLTHLTGGTGSPKLKLHNPPIDWSAASISSRHTFCHSHCLHSADTPARVSVTIPPKPPDLSLVPPVLHDLAQVFSKELALSLPLHHPYDCASDLLPGAPLPCTTCHTLRGNPWKMTSRATGLIGPPLPRAHRT